jgi:hypothetical protein
MDGNLSSSFGGPFYEGQKRIDDKEIKSQTIQPFGMQMIKITKVSHT